MGTTFRVVVFHQSERKAQAAAEKAFERINHLNSIFSNYFLESEVMNISTSPKKVSTDLWHLLQISKGLYNHSNGKFDVTIGPISKIWRRAIRRGEEPSHSEIAKARSLVNFKYLKMDKESMTVSFKRENMLFDFGGIAKGYAVDEAYKVLMDNGVYYALVDGGGDIYAGNHPKDGWNIVLQNTDSTLTLNNQAVASSGSLYQSIQIDNLNFSHIVNPKNGVGIKNSETINITGPSCTIADALATIISISATSNILKEEYSEYKKL